MQLNEMICGSFGKFYNKVHCVTFYVRVALIMFFSKGNFMQEYGSAHVGGERGMMEDDSF